MKTEPEILPLGVDGVLVRFARSLSATANAQALGFRDQLDRANLPGLSEIASSLTSVRVGFDPSITNRQTITKAIQQALGDIDQQANTPKRLWQIPACFSPARAPQLAQAAAQAGLTPEQAIAEITAHRTRVMAIGFAPGQPYLGMLPEHWDIPRQSSLNDHLPRGALIAAVRQLIIWAADAPTGWWHIGQTAFQAYRPHADSPFAFEPGDAVTFHAVSDHDFATIAADPASNGGARCTVLG